VSPFGHARLSLGTPETRVICTVHTFLNGSGIPLEVLEPFPADLSRGLPAILTFSAALRLDEHWLLETELSELVRILHRQRLRLLVA